MLAALFGRFRGCIISLTHTFFLRRHFEPQCTPASLLWQLFSSIRWAIDGVLGPYYQGTHLEVGIDSYPPGRIRGFIISLYMLLFSATLLTPVHASIPPQVSPIILSSSEQALFLRRSWLDFATALTSVLC